MKDTPTVIGWDAPLSAAIEVENFDLFSREIERFFGAKKLLGIPKGISTLGYASCSHWSITQYIFGLPIVNPKLQKASKYHHINEKSELQDCSFGVVETHPALSIYILLKEMLALQLQDDWRYKGSPKSITQKNFLLLKEAIITHPLSKKYAPIESKAIKDNDYLDTYVCYLLTKAFVMSDESVMIYGDRSFGTFLLPKDKELLKQLTLFRYNRAKKKHKGK